MNSHLLRLALLAPPLLPVFNARQVLAAPTREAPAPRTVVDYFHLLPRRYFEAANEREARENRKWMLSEAHVRDEKNDYLHTAGDGAQSDIIMALFRHQKRVTVAVRGNGEMGFNFELLRRTNGRWQNVTRALIPRYSSANFYSVPRFGTTIRVSKQAGLWDDQPGARLYDLAWRNGRFVVQM